MFDYKFWIIEPLKVFCLIGLGYVLRIINEIQEKKEGKDK